MSCRQTQPVVLRRGVQFRHGSSVARLDGRFPAQKLTKTSDRPILIFFRTDTDNLFVYVPDNRYAEPIFIYCYTCVFDTMITTPLN